jgi:peptidase M1-like protein
MLLGLFLGVALLAPPAQSRPQEDSAAALATRIESAAAAADRGAIAALCAEGGDRESVEQLAAILTFPPLARVVVKERDRTTLDDGALAVLWEIFSERGIEGRVSTWQAELVKAPGSSEYRIRTLSRLSNAAGLFRLTLDQTRQFDVHGLSVRAPDLTLDLPSGSLFVASTPGGPTAVVLIGRGHLRFSPPDAAERTQVRIFSGRDLLDTGFDMAFVRIRPADFEAFFKSSALTPRAVDGRAARRAAAIFDEYIGRSLQIDLGDLSRDRWSLIPPAGDFIAEIRTSKYGTLTYARSGNEPEDVSLFDRKKRRNISVYASAEKLAERGPFYSDDDRVDYDVLAYDIDTEIDPRRLWIDGNSRIKIRVRAPSINTLNLKLAESLVVRGVYSSGLGRLLHLRVVGQNTLVVNFPVSIAAGTDLWLQVIYGGRLEPQEIEAEAVQIRSADEQQETTVIPAEPRFLYSNRSYWYPQSVVTDYASVALRIVVPGEYDVIASGHPIGTPGPPPGVFEAAQRPRKMFMFSSEEPLRYLACAISRFNAVASTDLNIPRGTSPIATDEADRGPAADDSAGNVRLIVQANPRQMGRARSMTETTKDLFSFYAGLIGDAPYPSFTLAVSESDLPGGHSPAYFAVLNQSLPGSPVTWRNDPVSFDDYPTFFLAHEMAHQWWGQAVGWKNYHEQWISEGFAQYFAALYGRKERGDGTFSSLLRQMRSTALQVSDQGPIYLGYRLGHIRSEGRVFRALVYNKGAMVLHMLRRMVGDEAFFGGLRAFYNEWRFRKAGTDDFRKAMEKTAGRDLTRFFQDWIYGDAIPRVKVSYQQPDAASVLVRLEQQTAVEFPLTITLTYASGDNEDVVVQVSDRITERSLPLRTRLRNVSINRDHAALIRTEK